MKRYRVKAVGFGLALWAGSLHAGDSPPPAAPQPLPAALPATPTTAEWTSMGAGGGDTLWLAPRKKGERKATPPPVSATPPAMLPVTPVVVNPVVAPSALPAIPAVAPPAAPTVTPVAVKAEPSVVGPRAGTSLGVGALPDIPSIPEAGAAPMGLQPVPRPFPAVTAVSADPPPEVGLPPIPSVPARAEPLPSAMPTRPPVPDLRPSIAQPLPSPRPMTQEPDKPLPNPRQQPANPLPSPRPVTPSNAPPIPPAEDGMWNPLTEPPGRAVANELPTAPPELLVPAGVPVPGQHGTFGSAPVNISRDYPRLRDYLGRDGGWWGRAAGDGDGDGSTPAQDRFYYRAELLLWWVRPQQIPVLGSTSINGGLGFLGDPGTRVLLGPGSFGDSLRVGTRQRAGLWFDDCGACGIDGSFFFLGRQTTSAAFNSASFPTITRPIFAPNFNAEFGEIVALPNFSSGTLAVNASSTIWGFDTNLRHALCNTCGYRSEVFAGYRFLGMNESLTMTEFITALPGNPNDPAGTRVVVQDRFDTKNRFNGGQIGYAMERNWGRFSLDGRGSIAFGNTTQTLDISGSQSRLRPGMTTPDTFTGGLLATGPNLGHLTRDHFSVVPEVMVNAGFWLTPTIKAYFGYDFMYWTNVIRPGEQLDRVVDVTFVPNPPPGVGFSGQLRPQPLFKQSDLWVNGIQFGLMGRW